MLRNAFVICEIGEEGSEARIKSDLMLRSIFLQIGKRHEIKFFRADDMVVPKITTSMIRAIRDSYIVVADITNKNPNVFYELALRHALMKPVIVIMEKDLDGKWKGGMIPFDIADAQVIPYKDLNDDFNAQDLANKIEERIKKIIDGTYSSENPLTPIFSDQILTHQNRCSTFVDRIDDEFKTLSGKLDDFIGHIQEQLQARPSVAARYIEGEEDAFRELTAATRRAKDEVRSTRFFPDSVLRQMDYVRAIQDRVCGHGPEGHAPLKKYDRIISINNRAKERDVRSHIHDFAGYPFTLYLTPEENAFELVIIDSAEAFIHFYREAYVVASTLHITERVVVEKFKEIYDRIKDRVSKNGGYRISCKDLAKDNYDDTLMKVRELFLNAPASDRVTGAGTRVAGTDADRSVDSFETKHLDADVADKVDA